MSYVKAIRAVSKRKCEVGKGAVSPEDGSEVARDSVELCGWWYLNYYKYSVTRFSAVMRTYGLLGLEAFLRELVVRW